MINVYDGTLGITINYDKLVAELNKYIINYGKPLNYEVKENKSRVVIITGINEQEKELMPFNHPVVFKDTKNKNVVAIDLRLYMKSNLDDMINVSNMLADKYNGMLQLRRLIITKLMVDENDDAINYINKNLNLAFSSVIGTISSMLIYDKSLLDIATVAGSMHYATMDLSENFKFSVNNLLDMMPITYSKRIMKGDLSYMLNKINTEWDNLALPSRLADDLTHNIKILSNNDRIKGLNVDMLINSISRTYYALNNKELSLAMLENKPTFISILYSVMTEGINSKSNMRKIIDSRKSIIKSKEISKVLTEMFDDNLEVY